MFGHRDLRTDVVKEGEGEAAKEDMTTPRCGCRWNIQRCTNRVILAPEDKFEA